ncbi:MAG: ABC transporter permease, partial [Planctomycetes bacterium]|nr:ABC transporter permease [Planctomycetota bacterium]
MTMPGRRKLLVPEVVQTSAMDCGPAVLKAGLEGFGIRASYGRLREACQTDLDGTSIDTLEGVAGQLGLTAEQIMQPLDHLLLPQAEALPALLVVRQPNGFTHFVLVWRRLGPLVQVMDPALGRRWLSCRQLLDETYVHDQRVSALDWRAWAGSEGFRRPLAHRLRLLGCGSSAQALIDQAATFPEWRPLARLDAATRLVEALVQGSGVRRGREARQLLQALVAAEDQAIPGASWSVQPASAQPDGVERLMLRGAVLVRLGGPAGAGAGPSAPPKSADPALTAVLNEPPRRPERELFRLLRGGGRLPWLVLALGLALTAGGGILEGLILRSALELGRSLGLVEQRLLAVATFLGIGLLLLALELRVAGGLLGLGRRMEVRLRAALLEKLP